MKNMFRHSRQDIRALRTANLIVELGEGQMFCETPKAWEVWDKDPLRMVKRIPGKSVLFVYTQDESHE
jgi:hypothetical protein